VNDARPPIPATLEIGVDWLRPGEFSAEEKKLIVDWYSLYHGDGDTSLAPFVPFWLDQGPQAFRWFKRFVESYAAMPGALSPAGVQMLLMYNYACIGYADGMLYELIGAKETGASKAEIVEALEFAWVFSGPPGATPTARIAGPYLDRWVPGVEQPIWPEHWTYDASTMDTGLDYGTHGMSRGELDSLLAWYEHYYGEVPTVVRRLADASPESLKALRARYEAPHRGALPSEAFPMMAFARSYYRRDVVGVRRAVHHARRLNVRDEEIQGLATIMLAYHGDSLDGEIAELVL
jgi:alkylhydroperoxidase/carboxymuconolactone decarboxylase family protein YurZ